MATRTTPKPLHRRFRAVYQHRLGLDTSIEVDVRLDNAIAAAPAEQIIHDILLAMRSVRHAQISCVRSLEEVEDLDGPQQGPSEPAADEPGQEQARARIERARKQKQ